MHCRVECAEASIKRAKPAAERSKVLAAVRPVLLLAAWRKSEYANEPRNEHAIPSGGLATSADHELT